MILRWHISFITLLFVWPLMLVVCVGGSGGRGQNTPECCRHRSQECRRSPSVLHQTRARSYQVRVLLATVWRCQAIVTLSVVTSRTSSNNQVINLQSKLRFYHHQVTPPRVFIQASFDDNLLVGVSIFYVDTYFDRSLIHRYPIHELVVYITSPRDDLMQLFFIRNDVNLIDSSSKMSIGSLIITLDTFCHKLQLRNISIEQNISFVLFWYLGLCIYISHRKDHWAA